MFRKMYVLLITVAICVMCIAVFGQEAAHCPGKVELVHSRKLEVEVYRLYEEWGICQFPSADGATVEYLTIDDQDGTVASMVNTPNSYLKQYLQLLPDQEQKIQELRSVARQEFVKAVEGLRFCDDPRFPQLQSEVLRISRKLNEQSRALLFPHQFEAWGEFCAACTAMQNGSILNSIIEGNPSLPLSEKGRAGVAGLHPHVREMILLELQEQEKKAVREPLRDESPETRARIMKFYDVFPPTWVPDFRALMTPQRQTKC